MKEIPDELMKILEKFSESGWDLIAAPSAKYLQGEQNAEALTAAVKEADATCGACGCAYDPLYKRALQLLGGMPAKLSVSASNSFCPQTMFVYGTYREDGQPNFGLFCWLSYCWDGGLSVMAAIGDSKLTKDRIRETGVFSANLVTEPTLPLADYFGNVRGYDKGKMNVPVAVMQGAILPVPVLAESPVSFELKVTKTVVLDGSDVFICKIENVLQNEALADDAQTVEERLRAIPPAYTTCMTYFSHDGKALGKWGEAMKALQK